jgi:hypothetical protein
VEFNSNSTTLIDERDGHTYKSVKIGKQIWMAENLAYLPKVSRKTEQGGIWVYGYDGIDKDAALMNDNYKKYGCLYDWETAKTICPKGWHLPSKSEFEELIKNTPLPVFDRLVSPDFGFTALLCGYRYSGDFDSIREVIYFWSSTAYELPQVWYLRLNYRGDVQIHWIEQYKGFSVRCVKD